MPLLEIYCEYWTCASLTELAFANPPKKLYFRVHTFFSQRPFLRVADMILSSPDSITLMMKGKSRYGISAKKSSVLSELYRAPSWGSRYNAATISDRHSQHQWMAQVIQVFPAGEYCSLFPNESFSSSVFTITYTDLWSRAHTYLWISPQFSLDP